MPLQGLPRLVMALAFFAGMVLLLSMYAAPPATDTAAVEHAVPSPEIEPEPAEAPHDEPDPQNTAVLPVVTAAEPPRLEPAAAGLVAGAAAGPTRSQTANPSSFN